MIHHSNFDFKNIFKPIKKSGYDFTIKENDFKQEIE